MSDAFEYQLPRAAPAEVLDWRGRLADWWTTPGAAEWLLFVFKQAQARYGELLTTYEAHNADVAALVAELRDTIRDDPRVQDAEDIEQLVDETPEWAHLGENLREMRARRAQTREMADYLNGLCGARECTEDVKVRLTREAETLRGSTAYWTSADMATLVNDAYWSRPQERLDETHLPAMRGFAWFETPALLTACDGTPLPVGFDAVSWYLTAGQSPDGGTVPGVQVTYWCRKSVLSIDRRGEESGPGVRATADRLFAGLAPHQVWWPFGWDAPCELDIDAQTVHSAQWLQTFWSLSQQKVARMSEGAVARAARKRALRDGADPGVTVVTLRRERLPQDRDAASDAGATADAGRREWSCRWQVRGHWRNQWLPSTKAHRPMWIDEYVKGPEDKPFTVREKVYAWRR